MKQASRPEALATCEFSCGVRRGFLPRMSKAEKSIFRQWPGFTAGPPFGWSGSGCDWSGIGGGSRFTLIAGFKLSGHFGPGQTGDETPSGDWELAVTDWTALSVDALCAGLSANRTTATIPSSASTLLRELLACSILRLLVFGRLFRQWCGFGSYGGWIFGSGGGGSIFTLIAGFELSGILAPDKPETKRHQEIGNLP